MFGHNLVNVEVNIECNFGRQTMARNHRHTDTAKVRR